MKTLILMLAAMASTSHAAGTIFTAILGGSYESYAGAVVSDAQGNTYISGMTSARAFPVTAGAFQTAFTGTYDAYVAKLNPRGQTLWATYLGGTFENWAVGLALDGAGNVWIAGTTSSSDFPLVNPFQNALNLGEDEAFVAKLSPDGSKLLFSTTLAGSQGSTAAGIAVDSAGNAYVTVNLTSSAGYPGIQNGPAETGIAITKITAQGALAWSYFHPNGTATAVALDSSGNVYVAGSTANPDVAIGTAIFAQALVFKLAPDGSTKLWESAIGASASSQAAALAVTPTGEVWVGGSTSSANFPLVSPLEGTFGERPLWKSTNAGVSWSPVDNLPFAFPSVLVADPTSPTTLYQATLDRGVFKSVDGGATWSAASSGISGSAITALAIDPSHPQTLYAGATTTLYKSIDGANTWTAIDSPSAPPSQILVDAQNSNNVYEALEDVNGVSGATGPVNLRVSTNAGATWSSLIFSGSLQTLALDPRVSGHLFAEWWEFGPPLIGAPGAAEPYLYTSTNAGATWNQVSGAGCSQGAILADPSTNPTTVYCGLEYKSADGGVTWSALAPLPGATRSGSGPYAIDPSGAIYAWYYNLGLFVSHDHAQTWTPVASPAPTISTITADGSSGTLYTSISPGTAAFLAKLSADGSRLEYSTYLDGHEVPQTISFAYHEPVFFLEQNWISGIALDSAGNVTVSGGTRSIDLPTAGPIQPANAGLADAFVATISADGSTLKFSTCLGGSLDDGGLAVAFDSAGNVILAGQSWSTDFPVPNGVSEPAGGGDAFVVKFATAPPVITSVLNAASFSTGIEAGSWVAILGAGLANTNPGRVWDSEDFVNSSLLPTQLDGVSVTIDGKPAFVEYISPTQINVQAPSDGTVGAVNVIVDNNGAISAPATAQLQMVAPAFFLYPGTNYAVASRLPDYAAVGNQAVPAKPGDTLVLWGTGFGATSPPVAAGTVVTGTPTAAAPTLTIGGMSVPVISTILTAGSAGLYQITVQLPATAPSGAVAVQASVGGLSTPAGVTIIVGNP